MRRSAGCARWSPTAVSLTRRVRPARLPRRRFRADAVGAAEAAAADRVRPRRARDVGVPVGGAATLQVACPSVADFTCQTDAAVAVGTKTMAAHARFAEAIRAGRTGPTGERSATAVPDLPAGQARAGRPRRAPAADARRAAAAAGLGRRAGLAGAAAVGVGAAQHALPAASVRVGVADARTLLGVQRAHRNRHNPRRDTGPGRPRTAGTARPPRRPPPPADRRPAAACRR